MKKKFDNKIADMNRYSGLISMKSPIRSPIEKLSRIDQIKSKRNKYREEKKKIFELWEPRRGFEGFGYGSIVASNQNDVGMASSLKYIEKNP